MTLVGLMSFALKNPPMPPKLNEPRAQFVLTRIDQILALEQQSERERDGYFVELGRYLCEVRAGQYWRLERLSCFDDFLQRRFPASRRKAYYLMSIHENLPKPVRKELKQIGWSKAVELAKLARRQGQHFQSATWLHMARELPKDRFAAEIDRALNGTDAEPSDLIYFRVYKSQVPVIEQALEVAARMLGSDRSRGYCLEMICADFLAGVNLQGGDQDQLLLSVSRFFRAMPDAMQQQFVSSIVETEGGAARAA